METKRTLLAIILSFAILFGYTTFFPGVAPQQDTSSPAAVEQGTGSSGPVAIEPPQNPAVLPPSNQPAPAVQHADAIDITVETELYRATFTENGGALKGFELKMHRETKEDGSPGKDLVNSDELQGYPLQFSWGSAAGQGLYYKSVSEQVTFSDGKGQLVMEAQPGNGLVIVRTYTFDQQSYLIDHEVTVKNVSGQPLQGIPQLHQVNTPFEKGGSPADGFLFRGAESYINGEHKEIDADDFEDGPLTVQGDIDWAGYGGNYFLRGIVPLENSGLSYEVKGTEDLTRTTVAGGLDTLQPNTQKTYKYKIYYGPKKVKLLRELGYNLERSVNFGWFDFIARPTLFLLNFFYGFVKNYGIAIILVTIMFKAIFWPITQKGMKSMKNMQKLQPKMMKIKEKYKDDPTKMNQEVMNLYKTYKVNPLGGCLPMLLQIPVFFALYKVLLQSIELRHAPFMLWINDLAAPDRLWIGMDIPYLGGLPVLTLMMGASMWFQQKLTPTTADPAQARILQFLPIIFTFMFLNFASGLVLYWFVNNLLSILQQQLINRESAAKTA